jgi:hypothetical protein
MRTTINVADALLERARRLAGERRASLGSVVDDALRGYLYTATKSRRAAKGTRIRTYRGNGVRPGVDLDSHASLLDVMDSRTSISCARIPMSAS